MKLMWAISLVFAMLLAPGVRAQTGERSNGPDAMHSCKSFADCTVVYGCGDEAINKLYEKQYKRPDVCTITKGHDPKALPTCEEGKCVMVDITKENGQ